MKRNRLFVVHYHPRASRYNNPPKTPRPQVQILTKKGADELSAHYLECRGLGAARVIVAKIELDEEIEK